MRKGLVVSLTLVVVGLLTAGVSRASFEPVLLVGQITDARTGEPLEEVRVVWHPDASHPAGDAVRLREV